MTNEKLLSLLSFEQGLESVRIISDTEVEPFAHHIVAELRYGDDYPLTLPFIWYEAEDWLFTPWDWQGYPSTSPDDIEDIDWRVNDTRDKAIILNGLPRLL